jgi:GNAT superfamily N-acetyltransferase
MSTKNILQLKSADTEADYALAKNLFLEYASQLGVDLSFQNFAREIETIREEYSPPSGSLFLAVDNELNAVGCFGIRKFKDSICELKRMYLQKEFHGLGLGSMMLKKSIDVARDLGYGRMRLDTLPTMTAAISLYQRFRFYEIPPYRFNPVEGTKYFEIRLNE